ncbi:MAG: TonB-dependent receptor [Pseudomonadota bacterium]
MASWSLTGSLSTGAWAQAPALTETAIEVTAPVQPYRQFDKVEITGSSIVRKEQTLALPVMVFTHEDIRRTGLASMTEVLQALPSMGNFVEPSQISMIAGGYTNTAIHGLPTGTLVLVNGLRMATFGRPTMVGPERSSVDLQTLPLADVERIEVLTDGASSLYGTDAIAGVVNIILRTERKGVEIHAERTHPDGGKGMGWSSSLSWGQGQLQRDGHSFLMTLEASRRQELLGTDRPAVNQGRYTFTHQGRAYLYDVPWLSLNGSPATFEQRNATGEAVRWFNSAYLNGQCPGGVPMAQQNACLSNPNRNLGLYPDEDNLRLHARGERLIDNDLTLFNELLLSRSVSSLGDSAWPSVASAYGLTPGSAAYTQALQAGLDPSNTRLVWQPNLPGLRLVSEQTNGRLSVGLKGQSLGWEHSSQLYVAQSQARQSMNFSSIDYGSLGLSSNAVWTNALVLSPLDGNTPLTTQAAALRKLSPESAGTNTLYGLQVRGSRPLAEREGQDILLGLGLDWREEQTDYRNQRTLALVGPPSFFARRQVLAGFAELQLPITPSWEALLGLRTDHYQDLGVTTNAKLATRWAINAQWSMRGAIGTGFRAPSVAQTHKADAPFVWGTINPILTCNAEEQAIIRSLKTATGNNGVCDPTATLYALGNGNPDLKPEKSTQLNWGLTFVPHRNLRLAADVWAVRIDNMMQTLSGGSIVSSPAQYAAHYTLLPPAFAQAYGADPRSVGLLMTMQNMGTQDKAGLDLESQWRQPSDWGMWHLQAQVTYLLRSRLQTSVGGTPWSDLGQYNDNIGTVSPRWRGRIIGGLTRAGWSLNAVMNHTGSYRDVPIQAIALASGQLETVQRQVSAFTTWDLVLQSTVRSDLDVRLNVRNVFNREAPLSFVNLAHQFDSINPIYSNAWGRVIELGLTARF